MATVPPSRFETTLATGLAAAGAETTLDVSSVALPDGTSLDMANVGDIIYLTINPGGSNEEFVSCTGLTGTTFSGLTRGLSYQGIPTAATSRKLSHSAGESVVATDYGGWFYTQYVNVDDAQNIGGAKSFDPTSGNRPRYSSSPTFGAGTETHLIDKNYADNLALAGAPDASTTQKGVVEEATDAELQAGTAAGGTSARLFAGGASHKQTATANKVPVAGSDGKLAKGWLPLQQVLQNFTTGAAYSLGDALYLKSSDGKVYAADSDAAESSHGFIGFATEASTGAGQTKEVVVAGVVTGLSGLTMGSTYYTQATAGAIGTTPGTFIKSVGKALSATELLIMKTTNTATGTLQLAGTTTSTITCGFRVKLVVIYATATGAAPTGFSWGQSDGVGNRCIFEPYTEGGQLYDTQAWRVHKTVTPDLATGVVDTITETTFRLNQTQSGTITSDLNWVAYGE